MLALSADIFSCFNEQIQCAAKKVSPKLVYHFLSNHLEFLREILHVYCLFMYTQKYQAAFDCLQLQQSYRIFV